MPATFEGWAVLDLLGQVLIDDDDVDGDTGGVHDEDDQGDEEDGIQ